MFLKSAAISSLNFKLQLSLEAQQQALKARLTLLSSNEARAEVSHLRRELEAAMTVIDAVNAELVMGRNSHAKELEEAEREMRRWRDTALAANARLEARHEGWRAGYREALPTDETEVGNVLRCLGDSDTLLRAR